ncbi:MAG: hypothetical protein HYZ58_00500 [Acidobacteria bacterium]|nr:hypothetical protein [Acidobacteriota bacterium]MBI3261612.1 hypothetical protein [Acidobacteriota bacterium]
MTRKPGRQALVFVLITVLIDIIGLGMIMPVLPTLTRSCWALCSWCRAR